MSICEQIIRGWHDVFGLMLLGWVLGNTAFMIIKGIINNLPPPRMKR